MQSDVTEKLDRLYALLIHLDSEQNTGAGVGRVGVKIGSDQITSRTVQEWEGVKAMFSTPCWINFRVCMMAKISPDFMGQRGQYSGDGIKLCKAIAVATGAFVRALPSVQFYEETPNGLRFKDWNPPVFVFDAQGGYWPE